MHPFDAVVVSDLHLGAANSRSGEFLAFLSRLKTDQLILAGDIFDQQRLDGLRPDEVGVLRALRRWAASCRVTWLVGNHDPSIDWFADMLGITAHEEAVLDVGRRQYLVYHGHGWDRSLEWPALLVTASDWIYRAAQRVDRSHNLARRLKHGCKTFCRAVEQLRRQAVVTAGERNFDGVILGHSHVAGDLHCEGVHYLNSGCWTELPAGFVGVRDGEVRAYHWLDGVPAPVVKAPATVAKRFELPQSPRLRLPLPAGLTYQESCG
ncbi:MAG: UDP-2,3-diacylglucosamine diphosphatase [Pirellulales bacterium]